MVMVKLMAVPVQGPMLGVTVMVAVCGVAGLAAVKLMLPAPEVASPIAGLSLVQLKVAPVEPVRLTLTGWPPQLMVLAG